MWPWGAVPLASVPQRLTQPAQSLRSLCYQPFRKHLSCRWSFSRFLGNVYLFCLLFKLYTNEQCSMCFCVCLLWVHLARLVLIETRCYFVGTLVNLSHIFLLWYFCLSSQTNYLPFPLCQIFFRKDLSESLLAIRLSVNYALYNLAFLTFLVTFHLINQRPHFLVGWLVFLPWH